MTFVIPIPEIAAIGSDYSSIAQFDLWVAQHAFWSDLASKGLNAFSAALPYDEGALSVEQRALVNQHIGDAASGPQFGVPGLGQGLTPSQWRLAVEPMEFSVTTLGRSPAATMGWNVSLHLLAKPSMTWLPGRPSGLRTVTVNTSAPGSTLSLSSPRASIREGSDDDLRIVPEIFGGTKPGGFGGLQNYLYPDGMDPRIVDRMLQEVLRNQHALRSIPISSTQVSMRGKLDASTRAGPYEFWAEATFDAATVTWSQSDALMTKILEVSNLRPRIEGALSQVASSPIRISPTVSLFVNRQANETLGVIDDVGFAVEAVATRGNLPARTVISLCVRAESTHDDSWMSVAPFLGDRDFGYFVQGQVLVEIARACWNRSDTAKRIEGTVDFQYTAQEGAPPSTGRADLELTFDVVDGVDWESGLAPGQDGLAVRGSYTTRLLRLFEESGAEVPPNRLGELVKPVTETFAMYVTPLGADPAPVYGAASAEAFKRDFTRKVTVPIVQPFPGLTVVEAIEGAASAAVGAAVVRGNLRIGGE